MRDIRIWFRMKSESQTTPAMRKKVARSSGIYDEGVKAFVVMHNSTERSRGHAQSVTCQNLFIDFAALRSVSEVGFAGRQSCAVCAGMLETRCTSSSDSSITISHAIRGLRDKASLASHCVAIVCCFNPWFNSWPFERRCPQNSLQSGKEPTLTQQNPRNIPS